VADLATRPRGGWQVGTHFSRSRRLSPWLDGEDPCPDVYGVERKDGRFIVRHYVNADATESCCTVEITPRPGESDIDALRRAHPPFSLCARK
jgi:hypothetical protein